MLKGNQAECDESSKAKAKSLRKVTKKRRLRIPKLLEYDAEEVFEGLQAVREHVRHLSWPEILLGLIVGTLSGSIANWLF